MQNLFENKVKDISPLTKCKNLDTLSIKSNQIEDIESIKNLDSSRKAWRLVGGVLVERNLGEVMTSLKENIEFLE